MEASEINYFAVASVVRDIKRMNSSFRVGDKGEAISRGIAARKSKTSDEK